MSEWGMQTLKQNARPAVRARYRAPDQVCSIALSELLSRTGRPPLERKQLNLLSSASGESTEVKVFYAGRLDLLDRPAVSIVGTREVSSEGWKRAQRLARELVREGITVVSGLAKGVDTAAMTSAIDSDGGTVGVIGTPIDKAYPAENALLQETVWREHLLITPFRVGETTFKGNFPKRNRVMAAISDATVIIEASDTSGTLHQAAECGRLGRWLFILQSVADDPALTWPKNFIDKPNVRILSSSQDIVDVVRACRPQAGNVL